jgi:hypothetical protein
VEAGRRCKVCNKIGEFDTQCDKCHNSPFCDDHYGKNKRHGIVCLNCYSQYQCEFPSGCNRLWDDECVSCGTHVCNAHVRPFFVYEKNMAFRCDNDKGSVCRLCVVKSGTFTKHYKCKNCGAELTKQPFH